MHETLLIFPINKLVAMGIPPYVAFSWVATALILGVAVLVSRSMQLVPRGLQNFTEAIVEFFVDLTKSSLGEKHGLYFFPFVATIGIFIIVSNFLGLIPGFEAPTSHLNTTAALALPVFLSTHFYGISAHGFSYIKHFLGPMRSLPALPLMILIFFIEIIGHIARPLTLSIRLFGNMTAKHVILIILGMLAPALVPSLILGLGVLVSVIQGYVFTLLTVIYIAGALEEAH